MCVFVRLPCADVPGHELAPPARMLRAAGARASRAVAVDRGTISFVRTPSHARVHTSAGAEDRVRAAQAEEKIFVDKFCKHPKDFKKIASFLDNKTVKPGPGLPRGDPGGAATRRL